MNPAITPEPDPVESPDGVAVWPALIATLRDPSQQLNIEFGSNIAGRAALSQWYSDMQARHEDGVLKYGVPLKTNNGRSALVDAYQESLDGMVYLMQAQLDGSFDRALRALEQAGTHSDILAQWRRQTTVNARQQSFLLSLLVQAERTR